MTTEDIIQEWYVTYHEYYCHLKTETDFDEMWISISNDLMDYWHKQCNGEVQKLWDSFTQMLISYTNYYKLMNINYRRGIPSVETKGTGGRWLP